MKALLVGIVGLDACINVIAFSQLPIMKARISTIESSNEPWESCTINVNRLYAASMDVDENNRNDLEKSDGREDLEDSAGLPDRRFMIRKATAMASALTLSLTVSPEKSYAMNAKSRTEGYAVQRTEREWAYILSGPQYNILREGGTERPNSSILEGEDRKGEFRCAGCNTPLFASSAKFHSGTGWPSFASSLSDSSGVPTVEVENVSAVQANLLGAEIRCATCGGHLGDVFSDGFIYVNTPAFISGKRYCVDGAALIFKPENGEDVYGDTPPPVKQKELPDFLAPPKINAR